MSGYGRSKPDSMRTEPGQMLSCPSVATDWTGQPPSRGCPVCPAVQHYRSRPEQRMSRNRRAEEEAEGKQEKDGAYRCQPDLPARARLLLARNPLDGAGQTAATPAENVPLSCRQGVTAARVMYNGSFLDPHVPRVATPREKAIFQ